MKVNNEPYSEAEIELYAREFHLKGKTFRQIAFENNRGPQSIAKHVWRYLSERGYKL